MTPVHRFARFAALWSILVAFALAVEMPAGPGQPAGTVEVPKGLEAPAVRKAVLLAGTGRGWTVKEEDARHVVLFLEHGGWRSTLTLNFDAHEVTILSNSAKLDRKGVPKKIAIPETWVKFLKQDITKNLGQMAYNP